MKTPLRRLFQEAKLNLREATDTERPQYQNITIEGQSLSDVVDSLSLLNATPEQIEETLRLIRRELDGIRNANAHWQKVKAVPEAMSFSKEDYTSHVKASALNYIPGFKLTPYNTHVFNTLCAYFSGDKSSPLPQSRGIFLVGPTGCGKTSLIRIFAHNPMQSFNMASCRLISYEFAESGFPVIEKYSTPKAGPNNIFHHTNRGTAFDDLGTESERKYFGDKIMVMTEIILNRYDKLPHNQTHITTNLTANQISEAYGERVFSRIKEMFNIIAFEPDAPDFRLSTN